MNGTKKCTPSNITDFFKFADPQHPTNKNNETASNFDINSGVRFYTLNARQGILKKIRDIIAEVTRLKIDIAAITETSLNKHNY